MLEQLSKMVSHTRIQPVLNDGASWEMIHQAEKEIDVVFPSSLSRLYLESNGENFDVPGQRRGAVPLFSEFVFLTLDQLEEVHEYNLEVVRELLLFPEIMEEYFSHPTQTTTPVMFHKMWIPFAGIFGSIYIAVDLMPAANGKNEQIVMVGPDTAPNVIKVAENLEDFLDKVYQRLLPSNVKSDHESFVVQLEFEAGLEYTSKQ